MSEKTIFERIIDKEIPAKIVYETEKVLAFHDVAPQAPVHVLVIPKKHYDRVARVPASDESLLGALLLAGVEVAKICKIDQTGFRLVINNGKDGGESVPHLHLHVLGGRHMDWPPG